MSWRGGVGGGSDLKVDYDLMFKIVIIGDSAVGKTQILGRFAKNEFNADSKATLGAEYQTKTLRIDGKTVKAQIWDTAGQERYRAVTSVYYRGAVGAMLVYDISNRASFEHMSRWLEELRSRANKNIVIILIGNKCDMESVRAVPIEDAQEFAESENLYFMETSALETINIENAFTRTLTAIYETICKKTLDAGEGVEYHEPSSLAGRKIIVSGQEARGGSASTTGCC